MATLEYRFIGDGGRKQVGSMTISDVTGLKYDHPLFKRAVEFILQRISEEDKFNVK